MSQDFYSGKSFSSRLSLSHGSMVNYQGIWLLFFFLTARLTPARNRFFLERIQTTHAPYWIYPVSTEEDTL